MSVEKLTVKSFPKPSKEEIDKMRELFKIRFFDNLGENRGVGSIIRGEELFNPCLHSSQQTPKK